MSLHEDASNGAQLLDGDGGGLLTELGDGLGGQQQYFFSTPLSILRIIEQFPEHAKYMHIIYNIYSYEFHFNG